jgi:cell division protein FtsB
MIDEDFELMEQAERQKHDDKVRELEEERNKKLKEFDFWLGFVGAEGTNVWNRDRAFYLTVLKKKYFSVLKENNYLNVENMQLKEVVVGNEKEIEGLKTINSDLTKDNTVLEAQIEKMTKGDLQDLNNNLINQRSKLLAEKEQLSAKISKATELLKKCLNTYLRNPELRSEVEEFFERG